MIDREVEAAESARDKVRVFSISLTVPADYSERIDEEIEFFLADLCDATPGFVGRYSYKDVEM